MCEEDVYANVKCQLISMQVLWMETHMCCVDLGQQAISFDFF